MNYSFELSMSAIGAFVFAVIMGMMVYQDAHGHCSALDYTCTPACGDGGDSTCKVEPKSEGETCAYYAKLPPAEHIGYIFAQRLHCDPLGGDIKGGFDDSDCMATRGIFSGAPNLRSIFGAQSIGAAAHRCSHATGVPDWVLVQPLAHDKEWTPAHCPGWANWSLWAHKDKAENPNAVHGIPGELDVPLACSVFTL